MEGRLIFRISGMRLMQTSCCNRRFFDSAAGLVPWTHLVLQVLVLVVSQVAMAAVVVNSSNTAIRQQSDYHEDQQQVFLIPPLVESNKELAASQQQLVLERVEEWSHELQLEEQRKKSEQTAECRIHSMSRADRLGTSA